MNMREILQRHWLSSFMVTIGSFIFLLGFTFILSGCQLKAFILKNSPKYQATIHHDIEYQDSMYLDLFQPKLGNHLPAVILLHGGAWERGTRNQMNAYAEAFSRSGIVAINMDYHLAPAFTYPDPVLDIRKALKWTRMNAQRYHIDPERIYLFGYSAGGHLSLMAGLSPEFEDTDPYSLAGIISIAGPTDLSNPASACAPCLHEMDNLLGEVKPQEASPLWLDTYTDVPTLFIHSTLDHLVKPNQSVGLYQKLKANGKPAYIKLIPAGGHLLPFIDTHANDILSLSTSMIKNPNAFESEIEALQVSQQDLLDTEIEALPAMIKTRSEIDSTSDNRSDTVTETDPDVKVTPSVNNDA